MFLLYFFVWIMFNGKITLEICCIGLFISALLFLFTCKFMGYSIKKEISAYRNLHLLIQFIFLLVIDVFKANIATLHFILTQKEEVRPVLVTFPNRFKNETNAMLQANSITLTPGTITISADDNFTVHCLDETFAPGLSDTQITKTLMRMDEKE